MKKIVFLVMIFAIGIITLPSIHALEPNNEYFVETENIILVLLVDENNNTVLDYAHIVSGERTFDIESEQIKKHRISANGDTGSIYGHTTDNGIFYLKYEIVDENVEVLVKIWKDGVKTRIIENGSIDSLFF